MKITPTTSLNDAVKRIADGHIGAAMVIAILVRDHQQNALKWLREMDRIGMYGKDVWLHFDAFRQDMDVFLTSIGNGTIEKQMDEVKRSRGVRSNEA